jgi:acetyl-CoA carboxylase alpha subunit
MAQTLKEAIKRHLTEIGQLPIDEMLEQRYQKFRVMGKYGSVEEKLLAVSDIS